MVVVAVGVVEDRGGLVDVEIWWVSRAGWYLIVLNQPPSVMPQTGTTRGRRFEGKVLRNFASSAGASGAPPVQTRRREWSLFFALSSSSHSLCSMVGGAAVSVIWYLEM